MELLKSSVDIISFTNEIMANERIREWSWYFRGYMQWHCLADVVAELGQSTNEEFCNSAWAVIDPLLTDWDTAYRTNSGKAAWDHVNAMITRARNQRRQKVESGRVVSNDRASRSRNEHPVQNPPSQNTTVTSKTEVISPEEPSMPGTSNNKDSSSFGNVIQDDDDFGIHPLQTSMPFHEPTPGNLAVPTTSAPLDFENMFNAFDDAGDINFQAFDEVFMGGEWDFPGLGEEFDMDLV